MIGYWGIGCGKKNISQECVHFHLKMFSFMNCDIQMIITNQYPYKIQRISILQNRHLLNIK